LELWHETAGAGPPVLLVHAGVCDSGMWTPQWESFPRTHRTVRCDLRGFGRTPIPPEPYSSAADVAELLEALSLGPVAVVGASLGGLVALDLALSRPELVSSLVIADAPLPDHEWSAAFRGFAAAEDAALEDGRLDDAVEVNLRMWVDGAGREPADVDPEVRRRVSEMQRRAFELQVPVADAADDELLTEDLGERLGEVAVPTLVVTGELDVEDMQRIADRLAAEIPSARRRRIAGAAHLPSLERPERFDPLVLGFMSGG
jgi:pimeloyl-ACP methyl ester carboxylesterase